MALLGMIGEKHDGGAPMPSQTEVMLQIANLLKTIQDNSNSAAQQQALLQAEMLVRAMPENKEHPGISAYSYPEGDKARPKPKLKCPIFWVGYPETEETLRPDEIDALNLLKPGVFQVTKANQDRIQFTVTPKFRVDGGIESLSVAFPVKDDQKNDHRSKVDYCLEASGQKIMDRSELMIEIARLKAQLAAGVPLGA